MQPPFISSIHSPQETRVNKTIMITIQGNWPTPNWQFQEAKIDFNKSDLEVHIQYLGKSSEGMALQVLQPFTDTVSLSFPKAGIWKMIFKQRGEGEIIEKINVLLDE